MESQARISRRQLLRRGAGVLSSAIAAPAIIPASALGRDGLLPPSERITMGFIGIGTQGGGHLLGGAWTYLTGGYAGRKDVQVLAVCDVWRDRRDSAQFRVNQHYAETYGRGNYRSCEAYLDFRSILDRPDIDAVLIASPPYWHASMTIMAVRAGKDVYCEKPTAVAVRESQAVLEAVRAHGRVYQAGTQQRSEYDGVFRRACEYVRSGRIGALKEVYACCDAGAIAWPRRPETSKPVPEGLDWDLYLGPVPFFPFDGNPRPHRFDIGELNWAQHHYDIVQWATGSDDTGPVELFLTDDKSESHERTLPVCVNYRYASGVVVRATRYPGERIGDNGGVVLVGSNGRIAVDRDGIFSDPAHITREPLRPDEVHLYRSDSHSENFLHCVRTRSRPICDADVAHRSASMVLLGGVLKQVGRPLKWDPAKEEFIGDDEANRLLSITQRAPWCI